MMRQAEFTAVMLEGDYTQIFNMGYEWNVLAFQRLRRSMTTRVNDGHAIHFYFRLGDTMVGSVVTVKCIAERWLEQSMFDVIGRLRCTIRNVDLSAL
jgi:hypothetical protein